MTLVETSHDEHGFTLPGYNEICSLVACKVYVGALGTKVFLVGCDLARLVVAAVFLQDHGWRLADTPVPTSARGVRIDLFGGMDEEAK